MERQPQYAIGTQFMTRGKHPKLCTVTDILKTYNSLGQLVRIRYVAVHEFCGQVVLETDIPETTISRGNPTTFRTLKQA